VNRRLRILVHSYVPVFPFHDGAGMRMFHITRHLAKRHSCDLIQERWDWEAKTKLLGPPDAPAQWLESHFRRVWNVHHGPGERLVYGWVWRSKELQRLLNDLAIEESYDVLWSGNDTLPLYLRPKLYQGVPVLIAPTDSMHLQYKRQILREPSLYRKFRLGAKWALYALYQIRVMNRIKYWTMVNEVDARSMKFLSLRSEIRVIPIGVDVDYFRAREAQRDPGMMIFPGTLGPHSVNEGAAEWFVSAVWPLVQRRRPESKFVIVGRDPSPDFLDVCSKVRNLCVTGYVKDVRPFLWKAGIAVLPMRAGAGTKYKLLEAWAAGCAVVATRLAVRGIREAKHGENVLLADDSRQMAEAIVNLIANPSRQTALGKSGEKTVRGSYSWEEVSSQLESYLEELVGAGSSSRRRGPLDSSGPKI